MKRFLLEFLQRTNVKLVSRSYHSIRQIQTTTQRFQSVEEVKKTKQQQQRDDEQTCFIFIF